MMEFFSAPGAAEGAYTKVVLKKAAIDHAHNDELRRIAGIKPEIKAELLAVAAVSNRHRGKGLFEAFKFQQEENKKAGKPYFDEADYPSIGQINNFTHHNNVVTRSPTVFAHKFPRASAMILEEGNRPALRR
jgi:hypothetical protein